MDSKKTLFSKIDLFSKAMCKRRELRRIPLAEVWKRRFVLFSISLLITTLVGLVMLAVELVKLQRHIRSRTAAVGFSITVGGIVPLYIIFLYTILRHDQYPTGPVLIWANALYMLIGIALVSVAYLLPADTMFNMIPFGSWDKPSGESSGQDPSKTDLMETVYHENPDNEFIIRVENQSVNAIWNIDLIDVIQLRLTTLGGIILGLGLVGGSLTLFVIYRTHRFVQETKKAERIRRRNIRTLTRALKPRNSVTIQRLRDSVYDYAGWGNRTSDIFQERGSDAGRESLTPSILSTKITSASLVSATEEGFSNHRRRSGRNQDSYIRRVGETSTEHLNGDFLNRSSIRDKNLETTGVSSYEMRELNPDGLQDTSNE